MDQATTRAAWMCAGPGRAGRVILLRSRTTALVYRTVVAVEVGDSAIRGNKDPLKLERFLIGLKYQISLFSRFLVSFGTKSCIHLLYENYRIDSVAPCGTYMIRAGLIYRYCCCGVHAEEVLRGKGCPEVRGIFVRNRSATSVDND